MRINTVDELLREIARAAAAEDGATVTNLTAESEAEAEAQLSPLELSLKRFVDQLTADEQQIHTSTLLVKAEGKKMSEAKAYMVAAVSVPSGIVQMISDMVNSAESPLDEYLRLFRASVDTVLVMRQIDALAGQLVDDALGR